MKKGKTKMRLALLSALLLTGSVLFLTAPYSPTRARYQRLSREKTGEVAAPAALFTEADIENLPPPVQRYFRWCGWLGAPKMSYMRASFKDVDFVMSPGKTVKIDYEQLNLVSKPERFALISSSLGGIPFEGLDSFESGKGSMQGSLAKIVPLFDQRGEAMDRACLVTWLAECLAVPNAALQDFVTWRAIDETHAGASITWEGRSAGGVFTFAESGELLSFRTSDRVAVDMDGKKTQADWSGYFSDYRPVDGILQPAILQSVWHYPSGDVIYFNENRASADIRYT